jgi:beta-mannosidase
VRFASECLAFANIPAPSGLPGGAALRVHSPMWKVRAPRDLGAGWDFDDVRDHYLERVFGVDPVALRVADHERYLALGRAVTGEVMAQTFGEWRRARSPTRGGLIWFLRDLWPGAGWGVIDANGAPKPCWYPLRRALAPLAIAISDEGTNGLVIHVVNDGNQVVGGKLELVLWRAGDVEVGRGAVDVNVPAHGAREIAATSLFDAFLDLSFAYRFGPPVAQVVHARLVGDFVSPDAFWFPAGLSATRDIDVGLAAKQTGDWLIVSAKRFAQYVAIELPGWQPADDHFHLAPGQARTIALRRTSATIGRGTVTALNSEVGARIEVAP